LFERWHALGTRLLASPGFQRWAAAFPLTRPIARRRARALFDLCAGFVYSQVLLAAVRLRLLDRLASGAKPLPALAAELGLEQRNARILLEAAAALGLADRRAGDRYALGPLGAALAGNPGLAQMIEHHGLLYADLEDPVALLSGDRKRTALAEYWPYADPERSPRALAEAEIDRYTALMAATQPLIAREVLAAYPVARHRCLLDVGGGEGSFLLAAARHAPRLRLMLFDLPPVAERARAHFAEADLGERADALGGDFLVDPLPRGADLLTLVRILHDHDDEAALRLLRAAHEALDPGGTLLVAEPMTASRGPDPLAAYFGFYLLAMGRGRPRTPEALARLARAAGFAEPRVRRTRVPLLTRLLVSRKPGRKS